ncbi:MAG: YhbY family RNA-binding protein [Candidatus Methanofastidiosia archaeon]
MLDKAKKKEIMAVLGPEVPSVVIGRQGLSEQVISEIIRQLKQKKSIKISLHSSVEDKSSYTDKICSITGAELVDLRGRKLILYKS